MKALLSLTGLLACMAHNVPLFEETVDAHADRVLNLPLYGTPPSPHYSGFLNASLSTPGTFLHYWMAHYEGEDDDLDFQSDLESGRQKRRETTFTPLDPSEIPVIFWFNGGPGSSSLLGFLTELGPLIIKERVGLMRNPFAWSRKAHLIALESPAGVGYSFCHNATFTPQLDPCNNSDKSTASDARAAIQHFFNTKFPALQSNPVYLAGESYAGVYVPTLAKELLDNAPEVQLKGVAVGDPCTDNESQREAFDMLWYSHKYGFVTDETYDFLYNKCRSRIPHPITLGEYHGSAELMQKALEKRQQRLAKEQREHFKNLALENRQSRRRLSPSNLKPEDVQEQKEREKVQQDKQEEEWENEEEQELLDILHDLEKECTLAHRKFMMQSSMEISQEWNLKFVNPYALYEPVDTFYYQEALVGYMNRPDVREALNMQDSPAKKWYDDTPYTNTMWSYHSNYAACNDNSDLSKETWSMVDFYRDIAPRLQKTIVFNGDSDPCVTYEGTRRAILHKLNFSEIPGGTYRPWFYHKAAVSKEVYEDRPMLFGSSLTLYDAGPQFGGHVVNLEHNLSFVTVHGSGHMVPQIKPQAALQILEQLLHNKPMSPLMQDDSEVAAMNNHEFHQYIANWTRMARGYV